MCHTDDGERLAAALGLVHAPAMVHHWTVTRRNYGCRNRQVVTASGMTMSAFVRVVYSSLQTLAVAALLALAALPVAFGADSVTIGGLTYVNKGLVGVGRIPADLRDKFGETFGSGSGLALDPKTWTRTPDGYRGTFFILPDRGYNVSGTADFRARLNQLSVTFRPVDEATPMAERQKSVAAT